MFTSPSLLPSFIVVFFSFTVHIQKLGKINLKIKPVKTVISPPKTVGFDTVRFCKTKRGFQFGLKTVPSLQDIHIVVFFVDSIYSKTINTTRKKYLFSIFRQKDYV